MKNIWIINQYANTRDMPGHTRQYEIAKGLAKYGWKINVFASDFNLSRREYFYLKNFQLSLTEEIDGIKWSWLRVYPYKINDIKRYLNIVSFCLHISIRLFITSIFEKSPDIIFASSPQLPAAFICLLIAKILGKPFVVEIRDLWPQVLLEQGGIKKSNFIIKVLSMMEKYIYKNSDHVIVLAKGSMQFVRKRGAKNISWLPNGPDLNDFKEINISKEPEKFSFNEPFKIFYTGAHGEANALDILIDAARLIQDLPIKIVLVGDGPEKNNLIKYANGLENIQFLNPVPKKYIPTLLKDANAIALILKNINLFSYGVSPNKLYDAYALSKPVITNVNGDINDEVRLNNLGVTSQPGSSLDLAKSIKILFQKSKIERAEMGKRARSLAEKIYSREKVIQKYDELFKKLIF